MTMLRRGLLVIAAMLLAAPVQAQNARLGFISVGRGETPDRLLESRLTVVAGYEQHFGGPSGLQIGLRSMAGYTRFALDTAAYLDSVQVEDGHVDGGEASRSESGIDGLLGYRAGPVEGYGWYGVHLYRDLRQSITLNGTTERSRGYRRGRIDFGKSVGGGARLHAPGGSVFAEWFRGGGFDEGMIEVSGWRFGISYVWQ